jgi:hypothetical protein
MYLLKDLALARDGLGIAKNFVGATPIEQRERGTVTAECHRRRLGC